MQAVVVPPKLSVNTRGTQIHHSSLQHLGNDTCSLLVCAEQALALFPLSLDGVVLVE